MHSCGVATRSCAWCAHVPAAWVTVGGRRHQASRRCHCSARGRYGSDIPHAQRIPRRTLRCVGVLSRFAHRCAQRCVGHRPSRPCSSAGRREGCWRGARRFAIRDLRAKAAACLPARQAGVREGPCRRAHLFDRAADGVLQVTVGAGEARPGDGALCGLGCARNRGSKAPNGYSGALPRSVQAVN